MELSDAFRSQPVDSATAADLPRLMGHYVRDPDDRPDLDAARRLVSHLYGAGLPRWGDLASTSADDIATAAGELAISIPVRRRHDLAHLLSMVRPDLLRCASCGALGVELEGAEARRIETPGAACPACPTGHLERVERIVRRIAWTSGRMVPLGQTVDRETFPGEAAPLDDDGLRAWLGASLCPAIEARCAAEDVALHELLAWLRLVRGRVESIADAWRLFAIGGDGLERDDREGDLMARVRDTASGWRARARLDGVVVAPRRRESGPESWRWNERLACGTFADVYAVESDAIAPRAGVLKVAIDEQAGERLIHEATALTKVMYRRRTMRRGLDTWSPVPIVTAAWPVARLPEPTRALWRSAGFPDDHPVPVRVDAANVQYTHTLDDVRAHHGDALDPHSACWMLKRLFDALRVTHDAGVIHGAIHPGHVVIATHLHALRIVGWTHAIVRTSGHRVPLRDRLPDRRAFMTDDAWRGTPMSPAVDLVAAARTIAWLLSGSADGTDALDDALGPELGATLRGWAAGTGADALDAPSMIQTIDALAGRHLGVSRYAPVPMPDR